MLNKELITLALKDRTLVILTIAGTILALILIVSSLVQVRPSDVQVPVRYSAYANISFNDRPTIVSSGAQLGRDKWFYLLSFLVFGLVILILHPALTLKLLKQKGREFAVAFSIMTVLTGVIAVLIITAVLRVAS